jgi:cellulose synthase/poly-beta-1,6-N-acetylglucosamine synthase-like glycosyltransferase
MHVIYTLIMAIVGVAWIAWHRRSRPSGEHDAIDAIVPAYNEEICIADTIEMLLCNPYVAQVIVVNDGSTDGTAQVLDNLGRLHRRLFVIHQENTGKGGAVMNGVRHAKTPYVFLTDADTLIDPKGHALGYLLAEMEAGADAVGGIPASNLNGAGLLPHIRAAVKLPMIIVKRTFQQVVGGAPFLISGACGLYKRELLLKIPLSDRTKVEDLDLTWTLVTHGYKVRQANRCIVYSQECNDFKSEWLRWRRWIIGYAVCMRLHAPLLLSRFGIVTILPMFLVVVVGLAIIALNVTSLLTTETSWQWSLLTVPLMWAGFACALGAISAVHHRSPRLVLAAPLVVFYVVLAYVIWIYHGSIGLITGKEPERDKPKRYKHVVE